jgi:hypothetical protein
VGGGWRVGSNLQCGIFGFRVGTLWAWLLDRCTRVLLFSLLPETRAVQALTHDQG